MKGALGELLTRSRTLSLRGGVTGSGALKKGDGGRGAPALNVDTLRCGESERRRSLLPHLSLTDGSIRGGSCRVPGGGETMRTTHKLAERHTFSTHSRFCVAKNRMYAFAGSPRRRLVITEDCINTLTGERAVNTSTTPPLHRLPQSPHAASLYHRTAHNCTQAAARQPGSSAKAANHHASFRQTQTQTFPACA